MATGQVHVRTVTAFVQLRSEVEKPWEPTIRQAADFLRAARQAYEAQGAVAAQLWQAIRIC
jgi:hypothetical protein